MSTQPQQVKEAETLPGDAELPEGWIEAPLLEVIDYQGGAQPPRSEFIYESKPGYVRLLQIRDFGDKPVPTYVRDTKRLKKATKNDLLVARYGGNSADDSLGRVCTGLDGAYNVALVKLVFATQYIDREFLRCYFRGPWFKSAISTNSRSCQLGFNRDDLRFVTLPIPPKPEQERVASAVQKYSHSIEKAQNRLNRAFRFLRVFRQSVLAAACSGHLTDDWRSGTETGPPASVQADSVQAQKLDIPTSWAIKTLDDVCAKITDGEHINPHTTPAGVPLLSAKDVRADGVCFDECKFVSADDAKRFRNRCNPEVGDILIVSRGATIGRACIVQVERPFCLMGSVILLKAQHFVNRRYISLFLASPSAYERLLELSGSTAQQAIYLRDTRELQIPIPPQDEQHEIVRRVEALFKLADAIEKRVAAASARAGHLTQAVLAKAFRGELVPTEAELARREGREYEPASVLLERIKKEREKAEGMQPRGKRKVKAARTV